MEDFLQTPPRLPDAWSSDRLLRETLAFALGDELFALGESQLADMGRISTDPHTLTLAARAEAEPPQHTPFSPWGERIDEIRLSPAFKELGRIGVEAGITALPYEETAFGAKARILWAGLHSLWAPSSALYTCPVAMTDAAARTLLVHGDESDLPIVARLTTRDSRTAWTSGQWMTEMAGGSDVGRTTTVARLDDDGRWRLYGTKWFTSSTTSEVALTLARPEGAPEGSRGLALWRVQRWHDDGTPNDILVRRLKDKLGTRAVPTAELELVGAVAHPIGDPHDGGGVRRIATMLNLTRIHNALGAVGGLARGLAWARAHARVREVFGRPLHTMPAHRATLADLAVDYAAALALTVRCCELTGRLEHGLAQDDANVLRGLTPITKLATARWAVAGAAEVMEAIGGVGYCEDSTIPALVRNSHVLPIWEGTTNVLALDLLRAAARSGALEAVIGDAREAAVSVSDEEPVAVAAAAVLDALVTLEKRAGSIAGAPEVAEAWARPLAMSLAAAYACSRLCVQGAWAARRGDGRTAAMATRLAARGLLAADPPAEPGLAMDEELPVESPIA